MDADLKPLEVEMVFLERLARKSDAHAFMTLQLRDVELLSELTFHSPRRMLTLKTVRHIAGQCRALQLKDAAAEVIDGQVSRHVVICNPKYLTGVTAGATQATFRQLATRLRTHGEEPIAQLVPRELAVGTEPATLTVRNAGLGPRDAVRIIGPQKIPAWLLGTVGDTTVTLQVNPAFNGIYRKTVNIQTNTGEVSSTVTLTSWQCPPLTQDPVSLRSLATWHADIDEEAVTTQITSHLERLGYWSLPGGFFTRGGTSASAPRTTGASRRNITLSWQVEREHLGAGRLPAEGHLPLVRLYSPDGIERYDVQFENEALQGEGLEQLLISWDVKVGSRLSLRPYRGHYQFEVHDAVVWLPPDVQEVRVVASLTDLHRTPGFWDHLECWLGTSPVQVILSGTDFGALGPLSHRFPSKLTLRTSTHLPGTSRLHLRMEGNRSETRGLPDGQPLTGLSWPEELWRSLGEPAAAGPPTVVVPVGGRSGPDLAGLRLPALAEYEAYTGPVAHPVLAGPEKVLHSVIEILRVEGPMLGHHLYQRYGALVSIQHPDVRVGQMALKQTLNRLIYRASSSGVVVAEDEFETGGQIGQVYRLPDQGVRPRSKGDRTISLLPRSEMRAVAMDTPKPPGATAKQHADVILGRFGYGPFVEGGYAAVLPMLKETSGSASPSPLPC